MAADAPVWPNRNLSVTQTPHIAGNLDRAKALLRRTPPP
jgi:phosphoglycerate dehydrogenase-like enzyme